MLSQEIKDEIARANNAKNGVVKEFEVLNSELGPELNKWEAKVEELIGQLNNIQNVVLP